MAEANAVARLLSAANSDNATLIAAGPVRLFRIYGLNAAAAVRYLKLYDKATAPASTDTPKITIPIGASVPFPVDLGGFLFRLGLGYRTVTGNADNDATAVTAADLIGVYFTYALTPFDI